MSKTNVAIIDYGAGNVRSLGNMLTFLDVPYIITDDKEKIKQADKIISRDKDILHKPSQN